MPHLYCLRGDPAVLWLQVVSDLAIALAYYAIPFVLLRVVIQRADVVFRRVAILFVLFIAACGTTHLLDVWTIWFPVYRLDALIKAVTALLSVATALVLMRLLPVLKRIPSLSDLEREIEIRRHAEESIRDQQERLQNYVDGVRDYAIYLIGLDGVVQTWNSGAERIKGYKAAEIIGRKFSCFYTPEDVAAGKPEETIRTALATGQYDVEGWRMRKDGNRFWAKVAVRASRDASGQVRGFTKITQDLTERKAMEEKYQALLEAAPHSIFIVSLSGRIVYMNRRAEEVFGYGRDELIGKSAEVLLPERLREERALNREEYFQAPDARSVGFGEECICVRKGGAEFPVEVSRSPLATGDGPVMLTSFRDVTERKKAEERFRALLESAPDAMVIADAGGRIELVNAQAERLFGYARDEMIGEPVAILIPADLRSGYEAESSQFLMGNFELRMGTGVELRARRKDGGEFPVEINFSPLEGPNGVSLTAAIRDITDRKKAETRFRALLESAPDAMVIVNREGLIEIANLQTERLFGYARNELIGHSVDILVPHSLMAAHGEHREAFFAAPKQRSMGAGLDLMAMRKDGTEFPVEISLSPLEGPDGISVTAAIRDITDRKKAETRFRALLESAPDAMVIVNREGLIEIANLQTERLFGYARSELIGHTVDVLVPHNLRKTHGGHRREFFGAPKQRAMGAGLDLMAMRKDGTEFPVEISLSPLEGPDGISVTAAIRDTTERRVAGQQLAAKVMELRHSNEALEQFAHIASHDLQEPLRMVASYVQLLSKRYKGKLDSDADEFIAFAVDGTQRMKRLIEDLLLYSRAGNGSPPAAEFASEEALQEAVDNLDFALRDSGAVITHDVLPRVVAARSGLVQVLQNLIGNAIKYRGSRIPKVHVSAVVVGHEWVFSVADNGIGIDPRYFERVFEIFQRLHGRTEYQGTGIGLAICKRILQHQGGRIWVESEPEKGSVFHFSLPRR